MSDARAERTDDDAGPQTQAALPEFLTPTDHAHRAAKTREPTSDDGPSDARMKQILAGIAGLFILGGIWLLDEMLPGPGGAQRFFDRGVAQYKERKYDAAMPALNRAIAANPDFHAAYSLRAEIHRRRNEFDAAIADYTSAIRIQPEVPEAYYNRALVYLDLGDPDHALPDFGEYVRRKPDDADGHLRRAETFAALGDLGQALAERDALIRLSPKSIAAYLDRAALRRAFGDLDGAMRDIDAAIELGASDADTRVRHGRLWRDKGDLAHALADFEQAITLLPHDPDALDANDVQPALARGEALRDGGQTDAARAAFDAVIKRWPADAPGYQQRGLLALFIAGDAKAAADDLAAAMEKGFAHRYSSASLDAGIAVIEHKYDLAHPPIDTRPMLAADVPFYPAIEYLLIWRHIARLRTGAADADFASDLIRIGLASTAGKDLAGSPVRTDVRHRVLWPYQLVALFAGQTTPAVVVAAAAATPGDFARRQRVCEANLYVAEYQLTKNDGAEALPLLQAAVDGCPSGVPEAAFARAELQRANTH